MQLIMIVACAVYILVVAKFVENTKYPNSKWLLIANDDKNAQEVVKATSTNKRVSMLNKDLEYKRTSNILKTCYSGNLYQTVKSLGLFKLPGIRMVTVSGELFKTLLRNHTIKMTGRLQEAYKSQITNMNSRNEVPSPKSKNFQFSKRGSDLCEETTGELLVLAHANGQLAYMVEDHSCAHAVCSVPIGLCQKRTQTILLYVIDENGQFVSLTKQVGCACECVAS